MNQCEECNVLLDGKNNENNKEMCDDCLQDNVSPRYDNSENDDWGDQFRNFKLNILNKEY